LNPVDHDASTDLFQISVDAMMTRFVASQILDHYRFLQTERVEDFQNLSPEDRRSFFGLSDLLSESSQSLLQRGHLVLQVIEPIRQSLTKFHNSNSASPLWAKAQEGYERGSNFESGVGIRINADDTSFVVNVEHSGFSEHDFLNVIIAKNPIANMSLGPLIAFPIMDPGLTEQIRKECDSVVKTRILPPNLSGVGHAIVRASAHINQLEYVVRKVVDQSEEMQQSLGVLLTNRSNVSENQLHRIRMALQNFENPDFRN